MTRSINSDDGDRATAVIPARIGPDERLDQLLELIAALASGRLAARLDPSPAADRIDAGVAGVNLLAEQLQALTAELEGQLAALTQDTHHRLDQLARHDPLTGLANRSLLQESIDRAVARVRVGHPPPAVLVLGLDGFHTVNDVFGHAAGDELLVAVAQRLLAVVGDADTVARLGGDAFAVVVENATGGPALHPAGGPGPDAAHAILAALQEPIVADGRPCRVGASIGVCLAVGGESAETLLRDADTAMSVAKTRARGSVQVYEPAMHDAVAARVRLADELRAAVNDGRLALHYQPIVELATGRTTGVEAMLRWDHPTRGLLGATDVLPVAEEAGLVVELERWTLDAGIAQLAQWRADLSDHAPFVMHVNTTPSTVRRPGFAATVRERLAGRGLHAADLLLEITETRLTGEDDLSMQAMRELRAAGVGVAIDHVGTGCSSLGYLRRQLVDIVKVDSSLVTGLDTDRQQHDVAVAVLGVVAAFGLAAVADGIETAVQAAKLRLLGCRYGQGAHWGVPMSAAQMTAVLRAHLL